MNTLTPNRMGIPALLVLSLYPGCAPAPDDARSSAPLNLEAAEQPGLAPTGTAAPTHAEANFGSDMFDSSRTPPQAWTAPGGAEANVGPDADPRGNGLDRDAEPESPAPPATSASPADDAPSGAEPQAARGSFDDHFDLFEVVLRQYQRKQEDSENR